MQMNINKTTIAIALFGLYDKSVACPIIKEFHFGPPSTKKLSIDALIQEINSIVIEKTEVEYRDLSNL